MTKEQENKFIELVETFNTLNKEQQNYIKGVIDGLQHGNTQSKLAPPLS